MVGWDSEGNPDADVGISLSEGVATQPLGIGWKFTLAVMNGSPNDTLGAERYVTVGAGEGPAISMDYFQGLSLDPSHPEEALDPGAPTSYEGLRFGYGAALGFSPIEVGTGFSLQTNLVDSAAQMAEELTGRKPAIGN